MHEAKGQFLEQRLRHIRPLLPRSTTQLPCQFRPLSSSHATTYKERCNICQQSFPKMPRIYQHLLQQECPRTNHPLFRFRATGSQNEQGQRYQTRKRSVRRQTRVQELQPTDKLMSGAVRQLSTPSHQGKASNQDRRRGPHRRAKNLPTCQLSTPLA